MSRPALRFRDDGGRKFPDWNQIKIGELGKFIGGGTPTTQNEEFWKGNIPWVSSSDLSEDNIYQLKTTRFISEEALSKSATKLVPKNSILIVSRVGVGKVAITQEDLCTSQDFTNLVLHSGNHIFFAYLIKNKTTKLLEFNQGTSIKGFVKSDLEAFEIYAPSVSEQTKIANFLTAVDEKITQLTQKHDLLTQYKKGLMQQIFSQELRFKDDDGADFPEWEEKALGEACEIVTGKTPSTTDVSLWDGDVQFVTPTDINEGKYQINTARTVVEHSKLRVLPAGSIMFTCIASIGKMSLSTKPCITNQQINSLIPKSIYNNEYLYYALLSITEFIKSTLNPAVRFQS